MENFSALLALCEGNPPVTGGFPSQRPVTRRFDAFFDLHLNKRLKRRRRWFVTQSCSLWRHCNGLVSWLSWHNTWPSTRKHHRYLRRLVSARFINSGDTTALRSATRTLLHLVIRQRGMFWCEIKQRRATHNYFSSYLFSIYQNQICRHSQPLYPKAG